MGKYLYPNTMFWKVGTKAVRRGRGSITWGEDIVGETEGRCKKIARSKPWPNMGWGKFLKSFVSSQEVMCQRVNKKWSSSSLTYEFWIILNKNVEGNKVFLPPSSTSSVSLVSRLKNALMKIKIKVRNIFWWVIFLVLMCHETILFLPNYGFFFFYRKLSFYHKLSGTLVRRNHITIRKWVKCY